MHLPIGRPLCLRVGTCDMRACLLCAPAPVRARAGRPLFFHANYQKWDLLLPNSFRDWHRRWVRMAPPDRDALELLTHDMG